MIALPAMAAALAACSDDDKDANAEPKTPAPDTKVPEARGDVDMAKLLEPGALPEKVLGKDDAPVTMVEYASMTCSHCAHFHKETLPAIKEKYIDAGKVRLVFREFPFDPRAEAGFMLARCADDNYFPMVEVLYQQQGVWARAEKPSDELLKIARLAGFTQERFEACLTDDALLKDVTSIKERGEKEFGVNATPTFFINGQKYSGDMSVEVFSAIIDHALQ